MSAQQPDKALQALEGTDYFVLVWDVEGQIINLSRGARALIGLSADDGTHDLSVADVLSGLLKEPWLDTLKDTGAWQGEWNLPQADGDAVPLSVSARAHGHPPTWFSVIGHDLRERRRMEAQLRSRADYDGLTGALARAPFLSAFAREMERVRRYGRSGAFLFIDIDDFKRVNDTLGHPTGDRVLSEIVHLWHGCIRESDMLGRLGGDEFGIILVETGEDGARRVARECIDTVKNLELTGPEGRLRLGASVGIVLFPAHGRDAEELVARADGAMFRAKSAGGGISVFQQGDDRNPRWVSWAAELETAFQEGRFQVYAQPIYRTADREIAGYELLLRLKAASGQILDPSAFLAGAERSGFVRSLDRWVVESAVGLLQQLPADVMVSVNLSENTLKDPELIAETDSLLTRSKMRPERLQLELPSNAFMYATDRIPALAQLGVRLALDERDGITHSPWQALARLPLDTIKVSAAFSDGDVSARARRVLAGLVRLTDDVDMDVCAKAVADEETFAYVLEAGCAFAQGYYLGHPEPIKHLQLVEHETGSTEEGTG